jgi:branched-chain amino acid transport system permease protein
MRILNFAYGEFFMIATYIAYFCFSSLGMPLWLILPAAMIILFCFSYATEKALILPVRRRMADWSVGVILVTLGLQIILQNLALILQGGTFLGIPTYIAGTLFIGDFAISYERIMLFLVSLALLAGVWLLTTSTKLGLAMMAVAQNKDAAVLSGINFNTIYSISFGLSGLLAAVAGVLLMPHLYAYPTVGQVPIMKAFAVTLLGGMGNIGGAVIGGFILGIAETLAAGYISAILKDGVAFATMILILIIYPKGIGGLIAGRKMR